MDDLIKIIIGISSTVFGGGLGYFIRLFIEHRLAIERNRDNIRIIEFNKGASAFRLAFVDTIVRLRENIKTGDRMVSYILEPQTITEHEKAKVLFEPFVVDLVGFNTAWENYKNYEYNFFHKSEYFSPGRVSDRKDMSQYCLDQLNHLLEYAKPKI